ncbi:hypothetical protein HNQ77_000319 [Silvibacterium bohemicum]|uniref:Uncharacterized protein n=1 Tax=Silvibacterium bohemicum TaxID=1577686 RepID=A0A841JTT7_9BACT|nr:hypothetical protein [Silvibacterium bohemicum]MBB6142381.1 hypothetical protein [Silvibacterium bohemicum]
MKYDGNDESFGFEAALLLKSTSILLMFLVMISAARAQSGAPSQSSPDLAEKAETGSARLPSGTEVAYRIRLLPLASFPSLPAAIASQLQQKNCMVPQTYEARRPENVIHGAFEKQGSDDWAVLCSASGTTALYAFFQSRPDQPILLRSQRDQEWLGAEAGSGYGAAWGISIADASQIRPLKSSRHIAPIDHAGIRDSNVERSSSIHYFHNGAWVPLDGGN